MPLDILLEGLLFFKATPQKKTTLRELFAVGEDDWKLAVDRLKERLASGALRLVETDTHLQLVTAPELAPFVEAMQKDELSGDIGKAGAETLAIILYRGPILRSEIDRIRGVNSAFILRNLMVRGLVQRTSKGSSYEFSITPKLLQHLGTTRREELPRFSEFMNALDTFTANTP